MTFLIERLRGLWARKFVRDTLALQISKITVAGLSALSAILVFRLMGPVAFGIYGLAQSFLGLFATLDFTGIGVLTTTRLGVAIGENNAAEIHNLLGYYVKISLLFHVLLVVVVALAGPSLSQAIQGDSRPGELAAWLAVAGIADGLYLMVPIALQTRRSMKTLSMLQVANQVVLSLCMAGAVLIDPSADSLIAARLVYSMTTLLMAYAVYWQQRTAATPNFPPLRAVFRRALTVSPRPYWRWGVANAVDRSLAQLFQQIPMQVAGAFGGPAAAGFLDLALSGISQASVVTSAVFDNMQGGRSTGRWTARLCATVAGFPADRDHSGIRRAGFLHRSGAGCPAAGSAGGRQPLDRCDPGRRRAGAVRSDHDRWRHFRTGLPRICDCTLDHRHKDRVTADRRPARHRADRRTDCARRQHVGVVRGECAARIRSQPGSRDRGRTDDQPVVCAVGGFDGRYRSAADETPR